MELLKYTLALIVYAGIMLACSDENEPVITTMTVTQQLSNDGGNVTKVDRYTYTDDRLTNRLTTQNFYEERISNEVSFTYTGNEVTLDYSEGNTAVYILNGEGYATRCTYQMARQTRTYQFTYSDGYLTQVDEAIEGVPSMSNTFGYKDGELTFIAIGTNKIICTPGETDNREQLPCPVFEDTYPLSLHTDALYAHLLGKTSPHFIDSSVPDTEDPQEKTEYSYTTDSATGKVTKIDKKLTYTGTTINHKGQVIESTTVMENSLYFKYE